MRMRALTILTAALWMWGSPLVAGWAAETADPVPMSKTSVILKLDTDEPLAVRTKFQESPAVISIEFPGQRVVGSLPERASVSKGIIQTITTQYDAAGSSYRAKRFLRSIQIELTASYPYRVRSEAGRVVVEIDHPASVNSAAVEVGLKGGTIIGGLGRDVVSERFRAMQEALVRATPVPWTMQITTNSERPGAPASAASQAAGGGGRVGESPAGQIRWSPPLRSQGVAWGASMILLLALIFATTAGTWLWSRGVSLAGMLPSRAAARASTRLPSSSQLVDQLAWQAFERQGYQLVTEMECTHPLVGVLRVATKAGVKTALMFVGSGPFLEKQTVERFVDSMRQVGADQGFLIASGSFTVPAQRIAKESHVILIGREQLAELLTVGAANEYVTRQLEQQQARLDEAKETLRQYAAELDTLRTQRNEASWYLGEERARSAKLEAQLTEVTQQLRHHEAELQRWVQEAAALRKQWDESEWYLGESRERTRYLDGQLAFFQEVSARVRTVEEERDKAQWSVAEAQAKREALEAAVADLQQRLEDAVGRERILEAGLERLKQEAAALRAYGERRGATRTQIPDAFIEILNGGEDPIFSGTPHDISSTGVGLDIERDEPLPPSIWVRLKLPGLEQPIESRAQVVWQRAGDPPSPVHHSGCQLLDMTDVLRASIEQSVEQWGTSQS